METLINAAIDLRSLIHLNGAELALNAEKADREGEFVFNNYDWLKNHGYFGAAIPAELGGHGLNHSEICDLIRVLGTYCGSTSLAFSMHQHLVAAAVWKYKHKGESVPMLQNVAKNQLILVSTGARDWLESNGELIRTEGGYLLTAKKQFASQSVVGDMAVTSAPFQDPQNGPEVKHFAVSLKAEGVSLLNDWDTLGMRATGSQSIIFDNVFIPDSAVVLSRPGTGYHPVWDLVIMVAMPLIMSSYIGIAERAMEIAISTGKKYPRNQKHLPYIIGQLNNSMVSAKTQWKAMVQLANDLNALPNETITIEMLSLKSNVSEACIQVVHQAMEATGGQSFYRKNILERLFRDIQGSQFHPLPLWDQYHFTGERLLKKN